MEWAYNGLTIDLLVPWPRCEVERGAIVNTDGLVVAYIAVPGMSELHKKRRGGSDVSVYNREIILITNYPGYPCQGHLLQGQVT
jgi:hypothetical protein